MKQVLRICVLFILLLTVWQSNVFACRLFSMIADEEISLNLDYDNPSPNYLKMNSHGEALQAQTHIHNSGWALLAYQNGKFNLDNGFGYVFRGNGDASSDQSGEYNSAQFSIKDGSNVTTLMCHIRKASSGCGSGVDETMPDNPHPWIWYEPGITYTFAHNGTIYNKSQLRDLITTDWIDNHGGLQTFEESGCGGDWQDSTVFSDNVIDSELYFFWLMKNILDADGDVLQGLNNALSNPMFQIITDDNNLNFTFSDGSAIWAFRDPRSSDSGDPNYRHTLFWIDNDDFAFNAAGVDYFYHYKAVMSQPVPTTDWIALNENELVYLPRTGDVVVFPDFSITNTVEVKSLEKSWNWVGFPVMGDYEGTSITSVLESVAPNAFYVQHQNENSQYDVNSEVWTPPLDLNGTKGYKLLMSNEDDYYNLQAIGERVPPETFVPLNQGENWVSYFIQESQSPLDALPANVLDRLVSLKARDWYMFKKGTRWIYSSCLPAVGPCRTLDYGEMYIFNLSSGPSIDMIYEIGGGTPPGGGRALAAGSFEVQELNDYTALTIDIMEDPESITEIGIFMGDDCIGAQQITEFPVYMQAYNGDQSLDEISFQIVRESSMTKRSGNPETANFSGQTLREHFTLSSLEREVMESGFVIYHADLEKSPEPMITESALLACYPNPFNPSTTLRYELAKASPVSVVVYNMRGRVVENLYHGNQARGQHELTWNASSKASGLYFVVFKTSGYQSTQKVMLLK